MKFCPVVPPALCAKLPTPPHGMFAFAPDLLNNMKYAECFRSLAMLYPSNVPIVIDCPIYEGGESLDPKDMRFIENWMRPDFIVVPDVRHNLSATLRNFDRYVSVLGDSAMGVLQGKTWMELETCAKYMAQSVRKFAIPKDVSRLDLSRYELLVQLFATGIFSDKAEVHLFGGDWPYVDEQKCGQVFAQVKSFDSAEPFTAALMGIDIAKAMPPSRPEGWMNLTADKLGDGFTRLFKRNIETVERLARCN